MSNSDPSFCAKVDLDLDDTTYIRYNRAIRTEPGRGKPGGIIHFFLNEKIIQYLEGLSLRHY